MSLAKRVRDYRFAKGWGPDELASRAAISRTALYQIESGKTECPRAATLRRIAQALEVKTEVLLEDMDSTQTLGVRAKGRREAAARPPEYSRVATDWSREEAAEPVHRPRAYDGNPLSRPSLSPPRSVSSSRLEIERKFRELLDSPLGDGLARLVEESHRLLTCNAVSSSL